MHHFTSTLGISFKKISFLLLIYLCEWKGRTQSLPSSLSIGTTKPWWLVKCLTTFSEVFASSFLSGHNWTWNYVWRQNCLMKQNYFLKSARGKITDKDGSRSSFIPLFTLRIVGTFRFSSHFSSKLRIPANTKNPRKYFHIFCLRPKIIFTENNLTTQRRCISRSLSFTVWSYDSFPWLRRP